MLTREESLLLSSSVSLHFLGLGHSLSEEFPTECTKFQFLTGKTFETGKNAKKKKKSLKIPTNLVSGTLEKLRKIHNKEYIYIYLHTNYIYLYIQRNHKRD